MASKEKNNKEFITASELRARNIPVLDRKAGDFSKYTFWQYTSIDNIGYILDGDGFWVNNITAMNDLREIELHKEEKDNIFVQCFSNSPNEKIPMWYLYGGITGKGASIGLTPGVMRDYINSIKYVTELVAEEEMKTKKYRLGERLEVGKDFELQAGWVFYVDYKSYDSEKMESSSYIRVNYWNEFSNVTNPEVFLRKNYFIKDYPWEYEKEFRIVLINKTGRYIEKIKIDLPEGFRRQKNHKLKICLGPEISNDKPDSSGITDFDRCKQTIQEKASKNDTGTGSYTITVDKSSLKVSMDLMLRNQKVISAYVKSHPDYVI